MAELELNLSPLDLARLRRVAIGAGLTLEQAAEMFLRQALRVESKKNPGPQKSLKLVK